MILFCGIPSEPPLRYAIEAARKAGFAHVVFNQRHSHDTDLTLSVEAGRLSGCIRIMGECYQLDAFRGTYIRLMEWQHLPENKPGRFYKPDPRLVEKSRLLAEALTEWMQLASCRVLNPPGAMASNASKPFQAQIINACGFSTPRTLITNCADEVSDFLSEHGRVIYKSISSIRSIVRELKPADMLRLERLKSLPTQFQAFVPGQNVRVHVVGAEVFATEVETEAVDYRYAARDDQEVSMRATELPIEVEERCVRLSQRLGLPLCGIDLKRTPEGEFYCFEVNPSPAYTYYQDHTEQPIAEAVARYLAGG